LGIESGFHYLNFVYFAKDCATDWAGGGQAGEDQPAQREDLTQHRADGHGGRFLAVRFAGAEEKWRGFTRAQSVHGARHSLAQSWIPGLPLLICVFLRAVLPHGDGGASEFFPAVADDQGYGPVPASIQFSGQRSRQTQSGKF